MADENNNEEDEELTSPNHAVQLTITFFLYGTIFVLLFLLFCFKRTKHPKAYNVRNWVERVKSPLAEDSFGRFNWIRSVAFISENSIADHCGLDALCLCRVLFMGIRLACFGVFLSLWLIPIYGTAPTREETEHITDAVVSETVSHVPSGNGRLIATVVAAYMIFGYAMYLMWKELEWFRTKRYRFLAKNAPRNLTMYLRAIPSRYRSNRALGHYFQRAATSILEVQTAREIQTLEEKVLERQIVVSKLEHAINVREIQGKELTHKIKDTDTKKKMKVNSIDAYTVGLEMLNSDIAYRLDSMSKGRGDVEEPSVPLLPVADQTHDKIKEEVVKTEPPEEGQLRDAAFVTFQDHRSVWTALQTLHSGQPYAMKAFEAPDPKDILWQNVGSSTSRLQRGNLTSSIITGLIVLFWTIPMAFVASLSTVDALKREVPFLETILDKAPFLETVLAQIAPLFVVILNSLLPTILRAVSMLELPISGAAVEVSLLGKLAAFMIVQTFFVSALSGSIFQELANILQDTTLIVDLLANSLPAQSTYFIQILLVSTFIGMSMELLRVGPVIVAWLRSKFGPNLTEKEKNTTWLGLRPLADPANFQHGYILSQFVLYFMVLFVYTTLAPLCNFFLVLCFAIMAVAYRHQFVYIYPSSPDSGGLLWIKFMEILMIAMLIAEVTIIGVLSLKKAIAATVLFVPLIVLTVAFRTYIRREHFGVTLRLPIDDCLEVDRSSRVDLEGLKGLYVQPALNAPAQLLPENLHLIQYQPPASSQLQPNSTANEKYQKLEDSESNARERARPPQDDSFFNPPSSSFDASADLDSSAPQESNVSEDVDVELLVEHAGDDLESMKVDDYGSELEEVIEEDSEAIEEVLEESFVEESEEEEEEEVTEVELIEEFVEEGEKTNPELEQGIPDDAFNRGSGNSDDPESKDEMMWV